MGGRAKSGQRASALRARGNVVARRGRRRATGPAESHGTFGRSKTLMCAVAAAADLGVTAGQAPRTSARVPSRHLGESRGCSTASGPVSFRKSHGDVHDRWTTAGSPGSTGASHVGAPRRFALAAQVAANAGRGADQDYLLPDDVHTQIVRRNTRARGDTTEAFRRPAVRTRCGCTKRSSPFRLEARPLRRREARPAVGFLSLPR